MRDTDEDWRLIGRDEPYHGVLAHERFLRRNLTAETIAEFWRTGVGEIDYLVHVLERHFGAFRSERALDFGCGVGRLTRAMAEVASSVIGLDIAPEMIAEARLAAPANVMFTETLEGGSFDWINSIIVFQHIPPARGYVILDDLLSNLAPGGVISMQFTLYRDRSFIDATMTAIQEAFWDGETMRVIRQAPPPPGTMMMYDYDLNRVFACVARHNIRQLFIEHTNHAGCHGARLYGRRGS